MEISTRELRSLVADVDDAHHEGRAAGPEEVAELHRRSFLVKAGVASAAIGLGGLGLARRTAAQEAEGPFDLTAATYAAGVELAAVAAYQAAGGRGLLDEATLGLATTFAGHHADHAGTFNGLLTSNGRDPVAAPDQALIDQFGPMIAGAADAAGLLEIAHTLERAAASTYVAALGQLTIPDAALAVSQILPVEAQHALVLATALNKPIDERLPAFETTDDSLLEN